MTNTKVKTILICMAIFKSTAFSRLRKSFGNLTTCRSKGKNIVREKVTDVKNPRTLKQQKQRARFVVLVDLSGVFSPAVVLGFVTCPEECTPENFFVHLNQNMVEVSDDLEVTVDYEHLVLSKGKRAVPSEMSVSGDAESHVLIFTIVAEEFMSHSAPDDEFYAVVLEKEKKEVKVELLGERADISTLQIEVPGKWDMEQLAIYVFVLSKKHDKSSKTVYLPLGQ